MTDEELIAYLRLQGLDKDIAAADRIEALVREVQRWHGLFDEKHNLMLQQKARAEQLAATNERLEAALKGLVEHCEVTRDTAGFWKPRQVHQLSPTQWQSWCKQIKSARAALEELK